VRLRLFLTGLQVGQVGLAKGASDGADVKVDVILQARIEHLQHVGAELFARGAGEPRPAPDSSDGVIAALALLDHVLQLLP